LENKGVFPGKLAKKNADDKLTSRYQWRIGLIWFFGEIGYDYDHKIAIKF